MKTKIFVGNFDFSIDDDGLREFFEAVGEVVSTKVMRDAASQKSRGFGFVEFSSEASAKKAIEELNGKAWDGRVLKVCEERTQSNDEEDKSPTGYFRAQPLDIGVRRRKRADVYEVTEDLEIDYKDPKTLIRFMSEKGRIQPRRMTGLSSMNQRHMTRAIKRAQHLALLPYVEGH